MLTAKRWRENKICVRSEHKRKRYIYIIHIYTHSTLSSRVAYWFFLTSHISLCQRQLKGENIGFCLKEWRREFATRARFKIYNPLKSRGAFQNPYEFIKASRYILVSAGPSPKPPVIIYAITSPILLIKLKQGVTTACACMYTLRWKQIERGAEFPTLLSLAFSGKTHARRQARLALQNYH